MNDRPSLGFVCIALAMTLGLGACTHAPDVSSGQPANAPTASPNVPKMVRPLPQISDLDKRVTFTKNGVESSMGEGAYADFADIGVPIYPTLKPADTYVVKHADKKSIGLTIQGTVLAPAATVDAWYAARLGPSFKAGRLHLLGGEVGTFSRRRPDSNESILVQAEHDRRTGEDVATLTLTVTKRRR